MTSRLLALVLAFVIGSPVCWCCASQSAPQATKAKRSCCEKRTTTETEGSTKEPKKSCPCGSSMIKREMAKTIIDVPPPCVSAQMAAPEFQMTETVPPAPARVDALFNDTGPPIEPTPVFLRQLSLRL